MKYVPKIYTVESVTSGHPDKFCDQVSDAILDACLEQDPKSRVAVETMVGHGLVVIMGEVTTNAEVDYEKTALDVYRDIGYTSEMKFIVRIMKQSPDIAQGVNVGGAGDQGIMYGFATNETPEYMPKGIVLVHGLTSGLERLRKSGEVEWLKPDGKAQITIENERIRTILVSTQHAENISQKEIRETLIEKLIRPLAGDISNVEILVNPTGKFVIGAEGGF